MRASALPLGAALAAFVFGAGSSWSQPFDNMVKCVANQSGVPVVPTTWSRIKTRWH